MFRHEFTKPAGALRYACRNPYRASTASRGGWFVTSEHNGRVIHNFCGKPCGKSA
ncbi:hypothetical protein BSLA_02f4457 [Burkholderia stabilis]|nr:hypothetical protein BSLA_02f4457 [Burkholderia stabilis]